MKNTIVSRLALGMLTLLYVLSGSLMALPRAYAAGSTINTHAVVLDASGKILSWVPQQDQAYSTVVANAWNYLLNNVPSDPTNHMPNYYSYSYQDPDTQQSVGWPSDPGSLYSMLIESAMEWYQFSGDSRVLQFAQNIANWDIGHGMTSATAVWPNVPYASGDGGSLTYQGASMGNTTGVGDGTGVIEPDKVGELGHGFAELYKQTGNQAYLTAAINAANTLAANVRTGDATHSPWPFRVNAQTNVIREEYSADAIGPVELFDDLTSLNAGNVSAYQSARTTAWNWLMTYPMVNNNWQGYFEDVSIASDQGGNLNQLDAMMTARYLLQHPSTDPNWQTHVRGLLTWVQNTFGEVQYGAETIKEQQADFTPMGSHTAREASVEALLYGLTGDQTAAQNAYYSDNWATYMARSDGVDIDGPGVQPKPGQWFTDGYGDLTRNLMVSMAGDPAFAPNGQTHLLQTSSTVTSIDYSNPNNLTYQTFDNAGTEEIKVASMPTSVTLNGSPLTQLGTLNAQGWTYDAASSTIHIQRNAGTSVVVTFNGTSNQPPAVSLTAPSNNATFAAPASFTLSANASDSDGTVSKVEFYQNNTLLSTATTAPYSYNVQNLPVGSYAFTAKAYDNAGAVTTSTPISVTVAVEPAISAVAASNVTVNGANITWATDEPATSQVDYGTATSYGSSTTLDTSLVTSHAQALAGLQSNTTYHYRVRSTDAANNTTTSGDNTFTTLSAPDTTPPTTPANVTLQALSTTQASVSWQASTDNVGVANYTVYRGGALVGTVTGTSFNDSGLTPGQTYTYTVVANDAAGNASPASNPVNITMPLPDTQPPTVSVTAPTSGATVSGTLQTTANASDNIAVASVQFKLDGANLGSAVTTTPYQTSWNTTGATNGTHTLTAVATDTSGNTTTSSSVTVTVQNQTATLGIDTKVSVDGHGTVTTGKFNTAQTGETLFAFASSDGPSGSGKQSLTISGGGLTWTLVKRANTQSGTAEIWTASAPLPLTGITVASKQASSTYDQSLTVIAVKGSSGAGASASAGASTGAATVSLVTTKAGSLIFGVGNDWDNATSRTVPSNQTMQHQYVDTGSGDTFWAQGLTNPTGAAGSSATINDTAPTGDRWNLAAIEVKTL